MNGPMQRDDQLAAAVESPAERTTRLAWESERLDEAFAELAAGKGVSGSKLDEWLRCFAAGEPLPLI